MSKERLEEIKEKHIELIKENQLYTSTFLDTDWLIEQVELSNDVKEDLRLSEGREDKLWEQNKQYREARKRIEERYDEEYDIQSNEYMGGIVDGLMIAIGIIDGALGRETE